MPIMKVKATMEVYDFSVEGGDCALKERQESGSDMPLECWQEGESIIVQEF
jgi:hypothetical protein